MLCRRGSTRRVVELLQSELWTLNFELRSKSFGEEIDKQMDRERDCLYFDIRTSRRLGWFDGAVT